MPPLVTLPSGPRRAETTGMNHPSKADHLLIYTSSSEIVKQTDHSLPFAAEMHSSHKVHKSPQEARHLHSPVTSFTIHLSSTGGA